MPATADRIPPHGECTAPLILRLFGSFEATLGGDPLPRLPLRKGQWLLALLVLRGANVDRSWLAGTLWPESSEADGLRNLRNRLNDLRRAFGPQAGRLRSPTPRTLALDLTDADVDVIAFDQAIARGDPTSLEHAIALYRGPLLQECGEEWVLPEREAREQAFLGALETLAAAALKAGDPGAAEHCLRRVVAVDPLRESAQRALMAALAAGGGTAAALQVYRELRFLLHRELNAEPDPETKRAYDRLRAEARERAEETSRQWGQRASERRRKEAGSLPHPIASSLARPVIPPEGTVTFLFTDIAGSTQLWEAHPEAMREALARHDALLRQLIEAHSGHIFKTFGDQFCAAFATALEALEAAVAAQRAFQAETWEQTGPLRVRMALHTGAAEEREGDYFGPALNRVARLLEAAHGGQILLSLATEELTRDQLPEGACLQDLGEHRLKDLIRPERVFQLISPDLPADFPPLETLASRRNNLPAQPTPLLGREKEVGAARNRLRGQEVRLLTLTGPGGTGKTRLGLQVAAELLDDFADGVFFVDLAPISDSALVGASIARTLGVRETGGRPVLENLKEFLRERQLLLLLDNFEQVIDAASVVAELLAAAPGLKVLVTSRAVLHLRGEHEFPVLPLAVPDPKRLPSVEALSQYAAVELFIQRAAAVKPDFAVTNETAPAVAEICYRLDGLPLAIELAAARIRLLPPQAILSRMENRLKLLVGGARDLPARQQTLWNTIHWSYDLLDEAEQRLFQRLSVFVGGCSLEAAEAVCNAEGDLPIDVLGGLESLVIQSLVRQEAGEERLDRESGQRRGPGPGAGGEPRFGMLETIREFGLERLEEKRELEIHRRQHAGFYLQFAEAARLPSYAGRELLGQSWWEPFEREVDNLRAALNWCQEETGAPEWGSRLILAVARFFDDRGYLSEGRRWLEGALARETTRESPQAQALIFSLLLLARDQGDYATVRALCEQQITLGHDMGDVDMIAGALNHLGYVAGAEGHYERARALLAQCQEMKVQLGDTVGIAWALTHTAEVADAQGRYEEARALLEQVLKISRELGDHLMRNYAQTMLGYVVEHQGDQEQADALFREALTVWQEWGQKQGIWWSLSGLAAVVRAQGQLERAARLSGAAEALRETMGRGRRAFEQADYERHLTALRAALDEEAFAAAWAEGRALTLEQAITAALEDVPQG